MGRAGACVLGRGTWGVLGHGDTGSAGAESLFVGTHRALVVGSGDTWGAGALVLGHREMWDTGALVLGYEDLWGTGASAPRHRDMWGPMSHGRHTVTLDSLAGPCCGNTGSVLSSGIWCGAP